MNLERNDEREKEKKRIFKFNDENMKYKTSTNLPFSRKADLNLENGAAGAVICREKGRVGMEKEQKDEDGNEGRKKKLRNRRERERERMRGKEVRRESGSEFECLSVCLSHEL